MSKSGSVQAIGQYHDEYQDGGRSTFPDGSRGAWMPLTRVRNAVVENVRRYDTRALELYIGWETILWGVLTIALRDGLVRMPVGGIDRPALAVMFVIAGGLQVFAVRNQYPRWSATAAFFVAAVWIGTAWAMLSAGALQAYGILAAFNALAGVQVLFHRRVSQ